MINKNKIIIMLKNLYHNYNIYNFLIKQKVLGKIVVNILEN